MPSRRQAPGGLAQSRAALQRYIRRRVRSRQEAAAYLRRFELTPSAAQRLLQECERLNLLDDGAAARLWAEQWSRRNFAWRAIAARLAAKGFGDRALAAAERQVGPQQDAARARAFAAAWARRRAGLGPTAKVALARALAARGFDAELIERIATEASALSVESEPVS